MSFFPQNKGHTLGGIDKIWWCESENTLFLMHNKQNYALD